MKPHKAVARSAEFAQQALQPIPRPTLEVGEGENLNLVRALKVDDSVGETKAEVASGVIVKQPEHAWIRTHFRNQPFHFGGEAAGGSPAFAFVILDRRQQVRLGLRV